MLQHAGTVELDDLTDGVLAATVKRHGTHKIGLRHLEDRLKVVIELFSHTTLTVRRPGEKVLNAIDSPLLKGSSRCTLNITAADEVFKLTHSLSGASIVVTFQIDRNEILINNIPFKISTTRRTNRPRGATFTRFHRLNNLRDNVSAFGNPDDCTFPDAVVENVPHVVPGCFGNRRTTEFLRFKQNGRFQQSAFGNSQPKPGDLRLHGRGINLESNHSFGMSYILGAVIDIANDQPIDVIRNDNLDRLEMRLQDFFHVRRNRDDVVIRNKESELL